jgi:hypothetical protein
MLIKLRETTVSTTDQTAIVLIHQNSGKRRRNYFTVKWIKMLQFYAYNPVSGKTTNGKCKYRGKYHADMNTI